MVKIRFGANFADVISLKTGSSKKKAKFTLESVTGNNCNAERIISISKESSPQKKKSGIILLQQWVTQRLNLRECPLHGTVHK